MLESTKLLRSRDVSGFDVICAGEARWDLAARGMLGHLATSLRFRPGGAALNVAVALARRGLRVGLAASLGDDSFGRALLARVSAAGVDTGGVSLSSAQSGLVLVQGMGAAARVVNYRQEEPPIAIPAGWAAPVLLLTGLSPVVPHAAAFCKEARAARRTGTVVVVDVNARRHVWMGQDPRAIRAVMGEADVVRCSAEDMEVLGVDGAALRGMMRRGTVLVLSHATRIDATGPFGEIVRENPTPAALTPAGSGDTFTAAMCAALSRAGSAGLERFDLWARLIQQRSPAPVMGRSLHL